MSDINIVLNDWAVQLGEQKSRFEERQLVDVTLKITEESKRNFVEGDRKEGVKLMLLVFTLNDYISELPSAKRSDEWRANKEAAEKMKVALLGVGVTLEMIEISKLSLISYMNTYRITEKKAPTGWMNVIGIYPGYSSRKDISDIRMRTGVFDIGGYGIICIDEYNENNILMKLDCVFGKDDLTADRSSSEGVLVSNNVVFQVLLKGFTKKLGNPKTSTEKLETKFGVKLTSLEVFWTDKFGNELLLKSVAEKVGRGVLILTSKESLKMSSEKAKATNDARKF